MAQQPTAKPKAPKGAGKKLAASRTVEKCDPLSADSVARTTVVDVAFVPVEKPEYDLNSKPLKIDRKRWPRIGPANFEAIPIEPIDDAVKLAATISESNKRYCRRPKSINPIWLFVRVNPDAVPEKTGWLQQFSAGIIDGRPWVFVEFLTKPEHADLVAKLTRRRIIRLANSNAYEAMILEPSPPDVL